MALFSIRSERQLAEQINYNMMFRWFLDMDLMEVSFDPSTFSKNRTRLLDHDVATEFLTAVVELARSRKLLSETHFSVDGSLIQAWGSAKSFRPKDDDDSDNNGWSDFKGTKRTNDTHESKTDPESRMMRKGRGKEAKLSFMIHALMDNREGIVTDFDTSEANGTAERDAAAEMLERRSKKSRATVGADRGYDAKKFVAQCREMNVTPHVAQKKHSAIDGRTTRHEGYKLSISFRRRIEEVFGWLKTVAGLRKSRFKGRSRTGLYAKFSIVAYNLLRIANCPTT
jgi:IS5 family transposase